MKYIVTSEKYAGELEFDYDSDKRLIGMRIAAQMTAEQHEWLLRHIPQFEGDVQSLKSDYTRIKQVPIDTGFENFWRIYNYKEGYKTRAEKLWDRLTTHDKLTAIEYIRIYDGKLAGTGTAKLYPETYINQKRWQTK